MPFSALLSSPGSGGTQLLRAGTARRLTSHDGGFVSRALFTPEGSRRVEFYELRLAVGKTETADRHPPGTRKNLVVTQGTVEIVVEREVHRVAAGDAIVFEADVAHAYLNVGSAAAVMYLVITYVGNNSTATRTQFCEGAVWGEVGGCVGSVRTGERPGCFTAPGFLGSAQPHCECERGFIKPGNTGTATCNQFCDGAQWGPVGRRVGAERNDTGERLSCNEAPGFLGSAQLRCQWVPKLIIE